MIILGVDPGTAITGYGIIKKHGNKLLPIRYGVIRTEASLPHSHRLCKIYDGINKLINEFQPEEAAVEQLFFNKNTRTALSVGQARGVVLLALTKAGLQVNEYTPLQVKQSVVGYGRAEKIQVQKMVRSLLGLNKIPKPDDAADAMAIAICHAHSRNLNKIFKKGDLI